MKCNVGKTDRIIRLILGIVIGGIGLYFKSWWGLVGLIPVFTALVSWCPLYLPLSIKTCKK
nr:DUF2892 domain-containing protein [uncultured Carboxylicivirga sp.]